MLVNDDNDNKNSDAEGRPIADVDDDGAIANEDDLFKLNLMAATTCLNSGATATLSVSSDDGAEIRLWKEQTRANRLTLPKSWNLDNAGELSDLAAVCANGLWIEGVNGGKVTVTLAISGGGANSTDSVKLLVADDHNEGGASETRGKFGPPEALTSAISDAGIVNLTTGNLLFVAPVTRLRGNLMPFNVMLYYNSRSKMPGALGRKFQTNYDMRLYVAGTRLLLVEEDGRRVWFDKPQGETKYKSEARRGLYNEIETQGDYPSFTKFMLKRKGNLYYEFNGDGKLAAIRDLHGGDPEAASFFAQAGDENKVTLVYETGGKLDKVTDTFGRELDFSWSGNNPTVTDPEGQAVALAPTGLTGARAEAWQFNGGSWDAVVGTFTSPSAGAWVVTSDPLESGKGGHGRALAVKRPNPDAQTVQQSNDIAYNDATATVTVQSWYNQGEAERAESTFIVNGSLNTWTSYTIKVSATESRTAARAYSTGRLLSSETNFGGANTATWNYDARGNVLSFQDLDGATWQSTWTPLDLLESTTSPEGRTTLRTYETDGDLSSFRDERGNITSYTEYDAKGRVGKKTLPPIKQGVTAAYFTYTYGNLATPATETRVAPAGDAPQAAIEYTYTPVGWLTKVKDYRGKYTQQAYDARGNLTHQTGPRDAEVAGFPNPLPADGDYEAWAYDADDNVLSYRNPDGGTTRYERDSLGRLTAQFVDVGPNREGANADKFEFAHDGRDNLLREIVNEKIPAVATFTTGHEYDLADNLIRRVLPGGQATVFHYDSRSYVDQITDAKGKVWGIGTDAVGRVTSTTNPLNKTAHVGYDRDGLRTSVTDESGKAVSMEYWPDGMVKAIVDAAGRAEFDYNPLGQNTWARDADGNTTTADFNSVGWAKEQKVGANGASPATTTYNAHELDGSVTQATPPNQVAHAFTRDAKNLVKEVGFNPGPAQVNEKYTYTPSGLSKTTEDGTHRTWTVERDYLGRVTKELVPNPSGGGAHELVSRTYNVRGQVYQESVTSKEVRYDDYGYDPHEDTVISTTTNDFDGNGWRKTSTTSGITLHEERDNNGDITDEWLGPQATLAEAQAAGVVTHYDRDDARRITQKIDPTGKTWITVYDDAGRPTEVTDPLGHKTTTVYDGAGRVTRVTDARGAYVENTYYPSGRLWKQRDKNGRVTTFEYDERGRLAKRTNPAGNSIVYQYEDTPSRVTITDPDGGKVRRTLDGWGNTTLEERWTGSAWQMASAAEYDERGILKGASNGRGQTVTIALDALGRATQKTYSTGLVLNFAWTTDGQINSVTGGGTSRFMEYDENRRLTRLGDSGVNIRYEYDNRGRRERMRVLSFGGAPIPDLPEVTSYSYDNGGRLTGVTRGTHTASLEYDQAARLAVVNLPNNVSTQYTHDAADRLTKVTHRQGGINGSIIASAQYLLDNAGNRLRETYHDGSFAAYGYDLAYRLISESYQGGGTSDTRYYGYSAGGDRKWEARPSWGTFEHTWSDEFNRDEVGPDYDIYGGEWQTVGDATDKDLERFTSDPEKASGPAMVVQKNQLTNSAFELNAEFEPIEGTAEKPIEGALVFGRTDADNYFLAGAKSWEAVPEGEQEQRLHLLYFISRKENGGDLQVLAESTEPEILPVGTTKFQLRLRVTQATAELARKYGTEDWETKLTSAMPWVESGMPEAKFGLYSSREAPDSAAYRFDSLKLQWNTTTPILQTASYTYNVMHELLSVSGLNKDATYTYDADGNRETEVKGGVRNKFEYTFEGRLKRVLRGPDGGETEIRRYEYQGDTWQKRLAVEDGQETRFLYDGDDLLAEFNSAGVLHAHHATSGLDRTLWTMRRSGGSMALSTPLSGAQNVIAVADINGNIASRFRYSAFGERVNLMGPDPVRNDPSFQNRPFDAGVGIYDHRNRSFDPSTGRFLQRDPVLDDGNLMNPYAGFGNNPVTNADPMGEWVVAKNSAALAYVASRMQSIGLKTEGIPVRGGQLVDIRTPNGYGRATLDAARGRIGWLSYNRRLFDRIMDVNGNWSVDEDGDMESTDPSQLKAALKGAGHGALVGLQAVGNATVDTVTSTVTLGAVDNLETFGRSKDPLYGVSYGFARTGTELLAGAATAGLSEAKAIGTGTKIAVQVAKNLDRATNVVQTAQGIVGAGEAAAEGRYGEAALKLGLAGANAAALKASVGKAGRAGEAIEMAVESSPRSRLAGELFGEKNIPKLEKYLAKRGVRLEVKDVIDAAKPTVMGRFRSISKSEAVLSLTKNPTRYEVTHELSHFLDWRRGMLPAARAAAEQRVYDRLIKNRRWATFSTKEKESAFMYLLDVGGNPIRIK
ncbi:MAG: RHS repeat-associated core domain-containing protein [Sedimentisphaerales bacterium]|nr:RHS repeat-associated core domain-containing protein [Sedimentisphaerales bacterium]